jgi:archaeal flagellar protein FlaJ
MKLSGLFGGSGEGRPGETKEEQKARKELLKYVEKNLRHGRDEKSVRESLAQAGWHRERIEEAFSVMRDKGVLPKAQGKESAGPPKDKGKETAKEDKRKDDKPQGKDEKKEEDMKKKEAQEKAKEEERKQKEEKKRLEERKKAKEKEDKRKEEERKKREKEEEKKRKEKGGEKKVGKEKKDEKKGKKKAKKTGFSFHLGFPKIGKGKKKASDAKNADSKEKKKAGRKGEKEPSGEDGKDEPAEGGDAKKKRPSFRLPVRINVIPGGYRNWVGRQLYLSGSDADPMVVIRKFAIICLIIGAAGAVLFSRYFAYVFLGTFGALFAFMNAMLVLSVDRRGKFVDEILPDALLLLSANIRAGYIPSRALILSARKEFGPLSDAIRKAGREIMTGTSLEDGLRDIPKRIKSNDLERTIKLITEGIKGGGQIVTLLEENALDIRRRQAIRKEISANIMMYAIFIAFAGCLGAPGLYALSGYLTSTMAKLTPDVSMSDQVSSKVSFINMSGGGVSDEFLFQFSIAAILITTIFGGLILGLINSGKEKDGLKFAPILAIIALGVFFAASFLVSTMFSSMMPG